MSRMRIAGARPAPVSRFLEAALAVALLAAAASAGTDVYVEGGLLRGGPLQENAVAAGVGFIADVGGGLGAGARYFNEGHPREKYVYRYDRDGFAGQLWYTASLGGSFDAQLATGPYFSMNSTKEDGRYVNDFRVGLLSSAALRWHPGGASWYVGTEYDNAWVSGESMSHALLLRVGNEFGAVAGRTPRGDLTIGAGYSGTTQAGKGNSSAALELEAKSALSRHVSYSVSWQAEGNTGWQDRNGVTAKLWYDAPLWRACTVSAGAGPYEAYDQTDGMARTALVFSLRAMFALSRDYAEGLTFTRVGSFDDRDQDIVMLCVQRHF